MDTDEGRSMNAQLALFAAPAAEDGLLDRLRHAIGADALAKFAWWCRNGHRDMCAAVIWRHTGCAQDEARALVARLAEAA